MFGITKKFIFRAKYCRENRHKYQKTMPTAFWLFDVSVIPWINPVLMSLTLILASSLADTGVISAEKFDLSDLIEANGTLLKFSVI